MPTKRGAPPVSVIGEAQGGRRPKVVVLDAVGADMRGWAGYNRGRFPDYRGVDPWLQWPSRVDETWSYIDGWMLHTAGINDSRVNVVFDLEKGEARGSVEGRAIMIYMNDEEWTAGNYVENETLGFYYNYRNNLYEGVCAGSFSGAFSFPLKQGGYPDWEFKENVTLAMEFSAWAVGYRMKRATAEYFHDVVYEDQAKLEVQVLLTGFLDVTDEKCYGHFQMSTTDIMSKVDFLIQDRWDYQNPPIRVVEWMEEEALSITGPSIIEATHEQVSFNLKPKVEGFGPVDRVDWLFSYMEKDESWIDLDPASMNGLTSINITRSGDPNLDQWYELALEHGRPSDRRRLMEMKVTAKVYSRGVLLGVSNTHSFKFSISEEVTLTVSGPDAINPRIDPETGQDWVVFDIKATGEGVVFIRWIDWVFSYQNRYGEWVEIDKVTQKDVDWLALEGLEVPRYGGEVNWDYWLTVASEQGQRVEDSNVLNMSVVAKAISEDERLLNTSNIHFFAIEQFRRFNLAIPDSWTYIPIGPTKPFWR